MGVIAAVEDAVLEAVNTAVGAALRQTGSLPGGWTGDTLQRALQFAPGVFVGFNGMTPGRGQGFHNGRFSVYAVTKGVNDTDRRRGTGRVIGAYDIVEALLPVLDGLLVAEIGSAEVRGVDNLFRDAMFDLGGAVYAIQLQIPNMPFDGAVDPASLDDFITFDARFDINSAEADEPVAEDNVSVPQ